MMMVKREKLKIMTKHVSFNITGRRGRKATIKGKKGDKAKKVTKK